jgi:hypothetical protein
MITREQIIERLAHLRAVRERALADANACSGAVQDCEYWLEQLRKVENAPEDATEVPERQP